MGERQDAKDEIIGRRNCRTTIIQLNEKEKPEMGNLKKQSTQLKQEDKNDNFKDVWDGSVS